MDTLAYKPHLDAVLARLRLLYERRGQNQVFATVHIPSLALEEFAQQYVHGFCDYPDPKERIRFWDRLCKEKVAVEDDSVPNACLSEFDQGLYGGMPPHAQPLSRLSPLASGSARGPRVARNH